MKTYEIPTDTGVQMVQAADKATALTATIGVGYRPTLTGIQNPVTAPLATGSPNLPTPQAPVVIDQFNQSVGQQLTTTKAQAQAEADRRAKEYQEKIAAVDKEDQELQILQDEGMTGNLQATRESTRQKKEALTLEKQRVDENYNANQALIGEMEQLLTQGTQAIERAKANPEGMSTRGLEHSVAETTAAVTARVGVIQALLSARNGQIAAARGQLDSTLNAVTSITKDQIDYYTAVVDFYEGQQDDNKELKLTLTKEQKSFLDQKLNSLNEDVKSARETAGIIQKAMLDPDTALAYNQAGVSLRDTPEQIREKLGAWALVERNRKEALKTVGDTKPLSILDIGRYQELYPDAGVVAGDSEAQANAKVAESNSPAAKMRSQIVAAQENGNTYETVVAEINGDATVKDKATALAIAAEVYGVTETPASAIDAEITRLRSGGNLNDADIRASLRKRGYTQEEINNSIASSWIDQIGSALGF